ncbi:MAG: 16S rRNA (cytidine(1402)-2'-O)-methyltransferase [Spirochaetes bacterium]|jgi:16S rRNA (cytidine1402-2'-O)-methyltransferase|nr:16S rRNA (cytidine(1402)-2'-O)-methyltransferase [Spirochaetota bacterium]
MGKAVRKTGTLYIIASPIGNLEDITLRALRILKEEVSYVYCEDTRQTRKLLNHYGVSISTLSLHAHSSDERIAGAISRMHEGASIGYLTDSGTPAVSDPGSRLVAMAREHGIDIVPVPGPSALSAIVSVAGYPEKSVFFTGFLSKKDGRRRRELEELRQHRGIIVIYESPHRIGRLLAALTEVFPEEKMLIGREMTKIHEEFLSGTVKDMADRSDSITAKGEFTVAIWNRGGGDDTE